MERFRNIGILKSGLINCPWIKEWVPHKGSEFSCRYLKCDRLEGLYCNEDDTLPKECFVENKIERINTPKIELPEKHYCKSIDKKVNVSVLFFKKETTIRPFCPLSYYFDFTKEFPCEIEKESPKPCLIQKALEGKVDEYRE